jgi:hypothetical protein
MEILQERDKLLKALEGTRGFLGVRVRLGRPMTLCIDVSRDADLSAINATLRDERVSNPTEIVAVRHRHVARALVSNSIR